MKRTTVFLSLLALGMPALSPAWSQTPPSAPVAKPMPVQSHAPSYREVYCAGFISDRVIPQDLFVVAGDEGGLKSVYTERDVVYMNRGAGFVVNPGGQYILVRKLTDAVDAEVFDGQRAMMKKLGTVYA